MTERDEAWKILKNAKRAFQLAAKSQKRKAIAWKEVEVERHTGVEQVCHITLALQEGKKNFAEAITVASRVEIFQAKIADLEETTSMIVEERDVAMNERN